jgi:hypothetical protein
MKPSIVPESPHAHDFLEVVCEQKIPDKVLESYIEMYEKRGFSLEQKFYPDFEKTHPNEMFRNFKCQAGSEYTVVSLVAQQPTEWIFKVRKGNTLLPHADKITSLKLLGNMYWSDFITTASSAKAVCQIDSDLKISVYDNMATHLPVYILIFSVDKVVNINLSDSAQPY